MVTSLPPSLSVVETSQGRTEIRLSRRRATDLAHGADSPTLAVGHVVAVVWFTSFHVEKKWTLKFCDRLNGKLRFRYFDSAYEAEKLVRRWAGRRYRILSEAGADIAL